jgi:hypothetical protein
MESKLKRAFWGNDPMRGAALGRSCEGTPKGKAYLRKIRLDSGGYDEGGAYWGVGQPIYRAFTPDGFEDYTRADSRDDAKKHFQTKHGLDFHR